MTTNSKTNGVGKYWSARASRMVRATCLPIISLATIVPEAQGQCAGPGFSEPRRRHRRLDLIWRWRMTAPARHRFVWRAG